MAKANAGLSDDADQPSACSGASPPAPPPDTAAAVCLVSLIWFRRRICEVVPICERLQCR